MPDQVSTAPVHVVSAGVRTAARVITHTTPGTSVQCAQEAELVDAQWLPLDEYLQQDLFAKSPLLAKMMER